MSKSVRSSLALLLGFVCLCASACFTGQAYATTVQIPNVGGRSVQDGIESWRYIGGNQSGSGCTVSRGTRKDTIKVTRNIQHLVKGNKSNVNLNIKKQIVLKYEIFSSGTQKGKIYRVYKPSTRIILKECRYFRIFKLTTHTKCTLLEYGLGLAGGGFAQFEDSTSFTLPQQFPFKRDAFSEFLRRLFHIDMGTSQKEYKISPLGAYGTVSVVSR